jgi:hypothetical protein
VAGEFAAAEARASVALAVVEPQADDSVPAWVVLLAVEKPADDLARDGSVVLPVVAPQADDSLLADSADC